MTQQLVLLILAGTWAGILIGFGIISTILNYHWTRYEVKSERLRRIRSVYFSISFFLLTLMAVFSTIALRTS